MTKDLIKTLIAEYQQYVAGVKLIPYKVNKNRPNYRTEISQTTEFCVNFP